MYRWSTLGITCRARAIVALLVLVFLILSAYYVPCVIGLSENCILRSTSTTITVRIAVCIACSRAIRQTTFFSSLALKCCTENENQHRSE